MQLQWAISNWAPCLPHTMAPGLAWFCLPVLEGWLDLKIRGYIAASLYIYFFVEK